MLSQLKLATPPYKFKRTHRFSLPPPQTKSLRANIFLSRTVLLKHYKFTDSQIMGTLKQISIGRETLINGDAKHRGIDASMLRCFDDSRHKGARK